MKVRTLYMGSSIDYSEDLRRRVEQKKRVEQLYSKIDIVRKYLIARVEARKNYLLLGCIEHIREIAKIAKLTVSYVTKAFPEGREGVISENAN